MEFKKKITAVISAVIGVVSVSLGVIWFGCLCAFPALAAVLAFLGISSLFLIKYHLLFLFTGIAFLSLSIIYFIQLVKEKHWWKKK